MSKWDKLIKKILEDKDVTYKEAEKALISLGYIPVSPSSGSSHITFRKNNTEKITLVKTQNPVKKYLIKLIKEAILND